MFNRIFFQVCFIAVFTLSQLGVVTHDIAHVIDPHHQENHQDPEKTTAEKQCADCLSYAQLSGALPAQTAFTFPNHSQAILAESKLIEAPAIYHYHFSARAPPSSTTES